MICNQEETQPSFRVRLLLLAVTGGFAVVFAIAIWLNPDPRGFGTHQQLGLPPCQFRKLLGFACPHCGMTTSFSNVVRGRWVAAFQANPLGIPLALTWFVGMVWCASVAVCGQWIATSDPFYWLIMVTIFYLSLAFLIWIVRTIG